MLNWGRDRYGSEQVLSCEAWKELREQLREAALLGDEKEKNHTY